MLLQTENGTLDSYASLEIYFSFPFLEMVKSKIKLKYW